MAAGYVWTDDFAFGAGANGQQLKCLPLLAAFSKESLAIDVADSFAPNPRRGNG